MNYMKRAKEEYTTAINGLEALHKYQAEHQSIKVIFMGMKPISPVNVPNLSSLKFDLWKRALSWTSRLVECSSKQWNFDCSDHWNAENFSNVLAGLGTFS